MSLNSILRLALIFAAFALPTIGTEIIDDFSAPVSDVRRAGRGTWKFDRNIATCISDPGLYQKFNNHGPFIRWGSEFVDSEITLEFKPTGCQRVVFTLDGDGHIFRVMLMDKLSRTFAWSEKSSKTNKGTVTKPEGMPTLKTINDRWTKLTLSVKDGKGTLKIGEFVHELSHDALKRDKKFVTFSFASGQIALRNFSAKSSPRNED